MGVEKENLATLDHDEIINKVTLVICCIKANFLSFITMFKITIKINKVLI